MLARPATKCALIIFDEKFETVARQYVEESLQYRQVHQNFIMLGVSFEGCKAKVLSESKLDKFFTQHNISWRHTDSCLILKKSASEDDDKNIDEKTYDEKVLNFAKKFRNHSAVITYDYYLGQNKFGSLGRVRKHKRITTSHGFPCGAIAQVPLWGNKVGDSVSVLRRSFFGLVDCALPPYTLFSFADLLWDEKTAKEDEKAHASHYAEEKKENKLVPAKPPFDEMKQIAYEQEVLQEIELRQQSVEPVFISAEQDYANPSSIAQKLGNLFHAYAVSEPMVKRSHRQLASQIANELYKEAHAEWELEDCLRSIKQKVDQSDKPIAPRGEFQGLLLGILNMMHSNSILFVGEDLEEYFKEKCSELEGLKADMSRDLRNVIDHISQEIQALACQGKPYLMLLRTVNATIDYIHDSSLLDRQFDLKFTALKIVKGELPDGERKVYVDALLQELDCLSKQNHPKLILLRSLQANLDFLKKPSDQTRARQLKIAEEVGQPLWGVKLKGLSLCLLGICLGAGIGLAVYFSGGAALVVSGPLIVKGMTLSATLLQAGIATMAGILSAAAPVAAGVSLFRQQPLRARMEDLVVSYDQSMSL